MGRQQGLLHHAGGGRAVKCSWAMRKHHLLKTFWTAWHDEQLPDGTVMWTSPTGQTYTTRPGSRLVLPTLCLPTGELPSAPTLMRSPGERALMMPKRHRTRDQDRSYRINAERALNAAHVAARNQPPPFQTKDVP
jgi:hypothetical protein